MKTSNSILLGLGVFIFALPLFLAFSLKSKLGKDNFVLDTAPHFNGTSARRVLPESGYSVVKLKGPIMGDVFRVTMVADSAAYFSYVNGYSNDSVTTSVQSDTLFVEYATRNDPNSFSHTNIRLSLPKESRLVVDQALLQVQAYKGPLDSLQVMSTGYSTIQFGETENQVADSLVIRSLSVKASNGKVLLGNNVRLNDLKLDISGDALLKVNKGSRVERLSGSWGDDVSIEAPLSFLKQLLK